MLEWLLLNGSSSSLHILPRLLPVGAVPCLSFSPLIAISLTAHPLPPSLFTSDASGRLFTQHAPTLGSKG